MAGKTWQQDTQGNCHVTYGVRKQRQMLLLWWLSPFLGQELNSWMFWLTIRDSPSQPNGECLSYTCPKVCLLAILDPEKIMVNINLQINICLVKYERSFVPKAHFCLVKNEKYSLGSCSRTKHLTPYTPFSIHFYL